MNRYLKTAIKSSHILFMRHCWRSVSKFVEGFHTRKICERIDKAILDYKNGKSTYLAISVHPRSGKSQIVSKYLPPRFLGLFPDRNVIMSTYAQDLALTFSSEALSVLQQEDYKQIFCDINIVKNSAKHWSVHSPERGAQFGNVFAASLHAGLTGRGGDLAILDDYFKSREEAESTIIRDKTWAAFTNDFMTRLAPVHIVIILATSWHVDDIHGRIKKEMAEDPNFPRFEFISFPARKINYTGEGEYSSEFLFEERYNKEWYRNIYSVLGSYAASALMDCSPVVKGGNILDVSKIQIHDSLESFPTAIKYARVWDLGHDIKSTKRRDPDYTGGTLLAFRRIGWNEALKIPLLELWVKDYIEFRGKSVQRDQLIMDQMYADGPMVDVVFESTTDSIDSVNHIVNKLRSLRRVYTVTVTKGKEIRIIPLETIFEMGRVHIVKGLWNSVWIQRLEAFDGSGSTHDEPVDNLSSGYEHLVAKGHRSRYVGW